MNHRSSRWTINNRSYASGRPPKHNWGWQKFHSWWTPPRSSTSKKNYSNRQNISPWRKWFLLHKHKKRNVGRSHPPSKPIDLTLYDHSSEYDLVDECYVPGADKETFIHSQVFPFCSRPVGRPHFGLRSTKPSNKLSDKIVSHLSYLLRKATDTR